MVRRALLTVALALLGPASAAAQDSTGYCTADGGPQGQATDAEHSVLLGDPPLPRGVRSQRITVDGVTTRVHQAGLPWAEDAVLFLHGSPSTSRDWDDLMAATRPFGRAVSFDVSGYGKSEKVAPPEVQSTDGVAHYVQGVLDKLGIKRAVLVGHDFGGIWGMQWAVQNPRVLSGAVLMDGGVLIDYVPHAFAVQFATPGVGEQVMAGTTRDSFKANIQSVNPRLSGDYLDRLYDDYDRPTRCAILRYYRSSSENFQNLGREQAAALAPLRRPALVVWGGRDPYVPVEQAEKQKQAFPDARVEIFEEAGHWPHVEEVERMRNTVIPFLRPRLDVARTRAGRRSVRVTLSHEGVLPAYRVAARLDRGAKRLGASRRVRTIAADRSLTIRLRRPLRAGRHTLTISGRGLPRQRVAFRVR